MNYELWKDRIDDNWPPHCMDWLHVQMIYAMLVNEKPRDIVEIGCWNGFSSSAIFEALEDCHDIKRADFYDPNMQPPMLNMPASVAYGIHKEESGKCELSPECWLIDGDHWSGAVEDYKRAKDRNARIIIIHDSTAHDTIGGHDGTHEIAAALRRQASYFFEDCKVRRAKGTKGICTERGLLIGWMNSQPKPETIKALNELAAT